MEIRIWREKKKAKINRGPHSPHKINKDKTKLHVCLKKKIKAEVKFKDDHSRGSAILTKNRSFGVFERVGKKKALVVGYNENKKKRKKKRKNTQSAHGRKKKADHMPNYTEKRFH